MQTPQDPRHRSVKSDVNTVLVGGVPAREWDMTHGSRDDAQAEQSWTVIDTQAWLLIVLWWRGRNGVRANRHVFTNWFAHICTDSKSSFDCNICRPGSLGSQEGGSCQQCDMGTSFWLRASNLAQWCRVSLPWMSPWGPWNQAKYAKVIPSLKHLKLT